MRWISLGFSELTIQLLQIQSMNKGPHSITIFWNTLFGFTFLIWLAFIVSSHAIFVENVVRVLTSFVIPCAMHYCCWFLDVYIFVHSCCAIADDNYCIKSNNVRNVTAQNINVLGLFCGKRIRTYIVFIHFYEILVTL